MLRIADPRCQRGGRPESTRIGRITKNRVARLQNEVGTKDFFWGTNFLTKNAPKVSPKFWAFTGNWEISTTTTQRARKVNLQRQTLAPFTAMVDMEMLKKTRKIISNHSDSLACQGHFREEGRCGGGRYFDFPCFILWVRENSRQISEERQKTPTTTTSQQSIAIHFQFVLQYASNLYCSTFGAPTLWGKGSTSVLLPFVSQYASHLYCNTPPVCIAVLLGKSWWLWSPGCSPKFPANFPFPKLKKSPTSFCRGSHANKK